MSSHVRLVCLPTRDLAFADDANAEMAAHPDFHAPDQLQAALRPAYPSVLVRASELSGLRTPTWYVYRDGSFPWPSS
jgi:hypothetical protein